MKRDNQIFRNRKKVKEANASNQKSMGVEESEMSKKTIMIKIERIVENIVKESIKVYSYSLYLPCMKKTSINLEVT